MPVMRLTTENGQRIIVNTRHIIVAVSPINDVRREAGLWELRLSGIPNTVCVVLKDEKAEECFASVLADPDDSAYVETI